MSCEGAEMFYPAKPLNYLEGTIKIYSKFGSDQKITEFKAT